LENIKKCKEKILQINEEVLLEIEYLKIQYNSFFTFEEVFTSENGGKTRINRQIFNMRNENILSKLSELKILFSKSLECIANTMREIFESCNAHNIELNNLIFDDESFLMDLEKYLSSQVLNKETKRDILNSFNELIGFKNRIFNYRYYLEMIDTSILEKNLNRLGVEDLINSTIIFETINSYALQYEQLLKFTTELINFDTNLSKFNNLDFLEALVELHKRRIDNFVYANVKYKIFIEYDCNIELNKSISRNIAYLENALSYLIEQSCMDLVKKELKKGKIQKNIEINVFKTRSDVRIVIKNNGYEIKNINSLFVSDVDNNYTIDAKNLIRLIGGKLEVSSNENNDNFGVTYTIIF